MNKPCEPNEIHKTNEACETNKTGAANEVNATNEVNSTGESHKTSKVNTIGETTEKPALQSFQQAISPEDKRENLINATRKLQTGRRQAPESISIKDRNKAMIRGLILGILVVGAAVALLMVVGSLTKL